MIRQRTVAAVVEAAQRCWSALGYLPFLTPLSYRTEWVRPLRASSLPFQLFRPLNLIAHDQGQLLWMEEIQGYVKPSPFF